MKDPNLFLRSVIALACGRRLAFVVLPLWFATILGCGGGSGGVSCSLKTPARLNPNSSVDKGDEVLNEQPDQWLKFRRDRQNTGTITLAAEAYESVARTGAHEELWRFPRIADQPKQPFVASPVINLTQSVVYVGGTDGILYGMHLSDGLAVITDPNDTPDDPADDRPFEINGSPLPFVSSAVVGVRDSVDAVFAGGGNALIYGVNDQTVAQEKVWPNTLDNFIASSVTLGIDGTVYANSLGAGFVGICPNGALRFAASTGPSESSPAVGRDPSDEDLDGTVYVGGDDRNLRAFRKDGLPLWVVTMSAPVLAAPVIELDPDTNTTRAIYAVDINASLRKFDSNGRRIAAFEFVPPVIANPVISSMALTRGRLYLVLDDRILAIAAGDGTVGDAHVIWEFSAGARIRTSPAVAVNGEDPAAPPVLVFGADDGKIHFVRDDGAAPLALESFTVADGTSSDSILMSSPAIAMDGSILFGSPAGHVYRIQ